MGKGTHQTRRRKETSKPSPSWVPSGGFSREKAAADDNRDTASECRQPGSEQKRGNKRPARGRGLSSPGLVGSRAKRGLQDWQPGIRSASL